jgi:hypothetical protein
MVWDVASYRHVARVSFNGIMLGYKPTLGGGWAIPLKNMSSWVGIIIPNIWKNGSKPPTSYLLFVHLALSLHKLPSGNHRCHVLSMLPQRSPFPGEKFHR